MVGILSKPRLSCPISFPLRPSHTGMRCAELKDGQEIKEIEFLQSPSVSYCSFPPRSKSQNTQALLALTFMSFPLEFFNPRIQRKRTERAFINHLKRCFG